MPLLIADHSNTVRRTIRNTLSRAGIASLLEAEEGSHALALLGRQPIDVVVIGSALDDMEGYELARRIRELPAHRRTPLLMVSEKRSHEDVLAAVDCGIDHYILIPYPDELLVEKVQKSLEKAAALAAAAASGHRAGIRRLYQHRG